MAISSIELFAGVGMLGEGVRAGLGYLGIDHRSVCYCEREAYAAAVLVARMQEGSLDEAPVWADVTTFDATAWRGKVDCVIAGFPCQDLSVAGKRAGLDGQRSGLFFEVTRIAADCDAWLLILENVGGIASATASVMDEAEGQLEERAAARVLGELADLGWDAEWLHLSAGAVGASHGRERWFCLAYRPGRGFGELRQSSGSRGFADGGDEELAHADVSKPSADRRGSDTGTDRRNDATGGRAAMADAGSPRHEGREQRGALHGDRGGGGSTWTS